MQMVINIGKRQLEHLQNQLMPLIDQVSLHLLQCVQSCSVHVRQGINVVCAAQLCIDLHNQLSLPLQFLPLDLVLPLEVATGFISLLGLADFVGTLLNDLVFQHDALLKFLLSQRQSLLSCPIVSFVVRALLIKLKF